MSYFLLIHTSLDKAFAGLSEDGHLIAVRRNDKPREHGAFLHEAIQQLMDECGIGLPAIAGIGVTTGPGSYTGIRIGLAAAKGLGYASGIPLILCSNLKALAATAVDKLRAKDAVYVALIHAREQEYYAAIYDYKLHMVEEASLIEINGESYAAENNEGLYRFFGIGLENFSEITGIQPDVNLDGIDESVFAGMIFDIYNHDQLTDAGEAVPLYLKDVFIRKR